MITPLIGGVTYESQAMAYGHAAKMLVAFFDARTKTEKQNHA